MGLFHHTNEFAGLCIDLSKPVWLLSGTEDFSAFVRALIDLVPEGCIAYLEGGEPPEKVKGFLEAHSVPEVCHLQMGTLWPSPVVYHIPATAENLTGLAEAAEGVFGYEVASHFHVYRPDEVLLHGHDAFDGDALYASMSIPEENVRRFCEKLGMTYQVYVHHAESR